MPSVIVDHRNLILFARVRGFIDAEKLLALAERVDSHAERFGNRRALHGRLYDLSDAKVAAPDAIDALCRMMADPSRSNIRANRVAYFGGSPLVQMQVRRLCGADNAALFNDRRDAFAWAIGARPRMGELGPVCG